MDNDLDTLATALYVTTDDFLKQNPHLMPWRPRIGIVPRTSDAEILTLAVMQALLGFTSEHRWIRLVRTRLFNMFPGPPKQPGYNKRLRKLAGVMEQVIAHLARDTGLWSDDVWVADSTPVECGRSKETVKQSDLAGYAEYGYCASHSPHARGAHGLRCQLLGVLRIIPACAGSTS